MAGSGKRTAVYRFFDTSGALLYIGITDDLETRWEAHSKDKFWWHLVARHEVTWYESRSAAEHAEKSGILCEGPIYNRTWNKNKVPRRVGDPPPDPFLTSLVTKLREGIQAGLYPEGHVFHDDLDTALDLGASPVTFGYAVGALMREGLIYLGPRVPQGRKRVRRKRPMRTFIVGAQSREEEAHA
jgi:hypothetical protein